MTETKAMITKPAVQIWQGERVLYLTAFTVAEFSAPGFCRVDVLDPKDGSGFQRVLEQRRVNRLASDMARARRENHAFLPTSVLLATKASLEYDGRMLSFDTARTGAFNVVDGQHRIKGMLKAAESTPSLADFPLTAIISAGLPDLEQKLHFYLVNTTQRAVDKSIEQQIMAKLKSKSELGGKFFMPDRIAKEIRKDGGVDVALDIAEYLNDDPDSPWYERIQMANEDSGARTTIKQSTFVNSVKKYLLVDGHRLNGGDREETRNKMLLNYWGAVADLFVDDNAKKSLVFKSTGTAFFHLVSMTMFDWLAVSKDYRADRIKECFRMAFEHLSDDDFDMQRPEWWLSGGTVSALNPSVVKKRAGTMMIAINEARQAEQSTGES